MNLSHLTLSSVGMNSADPAEGGKRVRREDPGSSSSPTEITELQMLLESQAEAIKQLTEKTVKLADEVKKERDVNALQTEAITALIFLRQADGRFVHSSEQMFYENQWTRLLALREELNPDMRRADMEAAAGRGSSG